MIAKKVGENLVQLRDQEKAMKESRKTCHRELAILGTDSSSHQQSPVANPDNSGAVLLMEETLLTVNNCKMESVSQPVVQLATLSSQSTTTLEFLLHK